MIRDLRHAVRMLLQSKGWTIVVLLSLALGIGVNTTLFSAINSLLLKTLPVPQAERLVRLRWTGDNPLVRGISGYGYVEPSATGKRTSESFSYPVIERLKAANKTLTGLLACAPSGRVSIVVKGRAELATSLLVSGNYFEVLGLPAAAGRNLTAEDDRPEAAPVAMISYGYWQRRFGRDPAAIGQQVTVNQTPLTIVGVASAGYSGIQGLGDHARDVHIPLALDRQVNRRNRLDDGSIWWLQVVGRLRDGVTREQVEGNLGGVFEGVVRTGWETRLAQVPSEDRASAAQRKADVALEVSSASQGVYEPDPDSAQSLSILGIVVVAVLLIVCANVANLLLSRSITRRREIAVRLFAGATRTRLIRQLLTEGLLLACIGGCLAVAVAYWSRGLLPFGSPPPLDWAVFEFVAAISLLAGLAFGIFPALRATRLDLAASLKENSRSLSRSKTTLGRSLLVLQVALSVVLLVGAGLFLRTLRNLRSTDVGFKTENLLLVPVSPKVNRYDAEMSKQLINQLREAFAAVPAVSSVSLSSEMLLSGNTASRTVVVSGRPDDQQSNPYFMSVSPEFFDTLGIPLLAGRGFTSQDDANAPQVAVVNEAAVREYFPEGSPLGKRFGFSSKDPERIEVVGVIADTKYDSVRDTPPPTFYRCWLQEGPAVGVVFEIKTLEDPTRVVDRVRRAARGVDSTLPLGSISTQSEAVERLFSQERTFALAYALFGALSLALASVGLFGLLSYNVAQRNNEIGVRMALGAVRRDIVGMVLRESLWLVLIGVTIGLIGALAGGRLISSLLYDLAPTDPLTLVAASSLMLVVAAVASYLPALRASRVDPLRALHEE